MGAKVVLDKGHLTFSDVTLTAVSAAITARPGQLHDLTAQVSGQLNSANGGRLFVKYSNGTIGYEWRNAGVFNGSQNVNGNFTTPSGISSFQVGTEVVLDKGHLASSSVVLRALSDPIAVTAGDDYQFDGQVAGALVAPVGQGGQIVARYSNTAGGDAGVDVLWDNPANFNGTAQVQQTFNANPGATTMRLMLITNLDAGHLTYSNFGLQHQVTGYSTIQRTTYSVAGQSIAVKVAGDPELDNNGLFFLFSDHLGSTSAMRHPDGSVSQTKYLPFGGYRGGSGGNPITDRGYTGHKHNDNLGLIYMNARYYVVGISRFASADTVIPNPANPQSYNRYAYVLNRPLLLKDPTGHISCTDSHLSGDDQQACQSTTPLYKGKNSIVSFSPVEKVPSGWRTVQANYKELFGSQATESAPNGSVYIYYQQDVASTEGLLPFEIVARVLLGENTRGLLFDNPRFAEEVGEHWPQDQVAPAFIISRNAARSNETIAEHVGPNKTANPILSPSHGSASDKAYIVALGADQGWLVDPSFGADWYYHTDKNRSFDGAVYLDDTWVGDWSAGTYWQPGYGPTRTIFPFKIESSAHSPYN